MATVNSNQADVAAVSRFVELAQRGGHGFASSGEKAAGRLAKAILENAPSLDDQAIDGAIRFLELAKSHPNAMADILGS